MLNASPNSLIIVYYRNREFARTIFSIGEINELDERKHVFFFQKYN